MYWDFDGDDPRANADGMLPEADQTEMACRVTDSGRIGDAWVARITCRGDDAILAAETGGVFIASSIGLWEVPRIPEEKEVAHLDPAAMLIAAVPAERVSRLEEQETIRVARGSDDSWCINQHTDLPTEKSGFTFCVREGLGIVSGENYFEGGSFGHSGRSKFTLIR